MIPHSLFPVRPVTPVVDPVYAVVGFRSLEPRPYPLCETLSVIPNFLNSQFATRSLLLYSSSLSDVA